MTWHILQTTPGRERGVAVSLAARGVMVLCPLVRISRRKVTPMFPGYVLFGLDTAARRALNEIGHAHTLMLREETPATLSHGTIEAIRARADELADRWRQPFRPGDRVVVSDDGGPWEGVHGLVQRLDGNDKIVIEALLPGRRAALISLPTRWLEPAKDAPPVPAKAGMRRAGTKARALA